MVMRWVEVASYVGLDRRKRKRVWLFNRRRRDLSEPVPGVQVLLRLLHLRTLDVRTLRETLPQFRERLALATRVTRELGQDDAAICLDDARKKLGRHSGDADSAELLEVEVSVKSALTALR